MIISLIMYFVLPVVILVYVFKVGIKAWKQADVDERIEDLKTQTELFDKVKSKNVAEARFEKTMELITAKEAKNKTMENIKKIPTSVISAINEAINNKMFECSVSVEDFSTSGLVQKALEQKGYKVSPYISDDMINMLAISWYGID